MGGREQEEGREEHFRWRDQYMQMARGKRDQGWVNVCRAWRKTVCMFGEWDLIVRTRVMGWGEFQMPEVSAHGLGPVAQLGSLALTLAAAPSQWPLGYGSTCSQAGCGQKRVVAGEPFKFSEVPFSGVVLSGHSLGDPAVTRSGVGAQVCRPCLGCNEEKSQGLLAVLGKETPLPGFPSGWASSCRPS